MSNGLLVCLSVCPFVCLFGPLLQQQEQQRNRVEKGHFSVPPATNYL